MDGYANGDRLDLEHGGADVWGEVGFRQHHDRLSAAFPGGRDVPLEPPQAEVVVEAGEQESRVDVRRQHLLGGILAGVLADEGASPRQDRRDRCGWHHPDPVADGRQLPAHVVFVEKATGGSRAQLALLGEEHELAAVLGRDAGRKQIVVL